MRAPETCSDEDIWSRGNILGCGISMGDYYDCWHWLTKWDQAPAGLGNEVIYRAKHETHLERWFLIAVKSDATHDEGCGREQDR